MFRKTAKKQYIKLDIPFALILIMILEKEAEKKARGRIIDQQKLSSG